MKPSAVFKSKTKRNFESNFQSNTTPYDANGSSYFDNSKDANRWDKKSFNMKYSNKDRNNMGIVYRKSNNNLLELIP